MSEDVQLGIVVVIVLACAWRAFRRYAPVAAWRLQARLSFALETSSGGTARRIGRWLRPVQPAESAGCGSGCVQCSGCATAPAADQAIART